MINQNDVAKWLQEVEHPAKGDKNLMELGMVEKIEIEEKDERNRFIRNKAWAWAGYLFVMIMSVATIVLKVIGQELLMMAASGSVCLVLVLFWISYYVLKRKY